jgi:hypothetical protein
VSCQHGWEIVDLDINGTSYGPAVIRWCRICLDYISLGPANDSPETLVEKRAAEIVAGGPDFTSMTFHERIGWWNMPMAKPESSECWAGWLARHIYEDRQVDVTTKAVLP